ncbi:MAG: hypothetical protein ACOCUU_01170 [Nanoarchaeota archaeon]
MEKFHGRPNYKVYLQLGKPKFVDIGRPRVARNLENWTDYLHEFFERPFQESLNSETIKKARVFENTSFHKSYPDYREWKKPGRLSEDYEFGDLQNRDILN